MNVDRPIPRRQCIHSQRDGQHQLTGTRTEAPSSTESRNAAEPDECAAPTLGYSWR
jgi:hypothetical protein